MWKQIRSAVEDVKEFGNGAMSEVSQGVHQGRKLAAQTATKAPQLAGAAASFVEGKRNRRPANGDNSAESRGGASDPADDLSAAESDTRSTLLEHSVSTAASGDDCASHRVDGSGEEMRPTEQPVHVNVQPHSPSLAMQLTRLNSSDSVSLSDDGNNSSTAARLSGTSPSPLRRQGPPQLLPDLAVCGLPATSLAFESSSADSESDGQLTSSRSHEEAPEEEHEAASDRSMSADNAPVDAPTERSRPAEKAGNGLPSVPAAALESTDQFGSPEGDLASARRVASDSDAAHVGRGSSTSSSNAAQGLTSAAATASDPTETPRLSAAEGAALRRKCAALEQQLAVERHVSKAVEQEKDDIDASLAALSRQVQEREEEAAGLRAERHAVDAAVDELRTMLMQSVGERSRLAGEVEAGENLIAAAQQEALEKAAAIESAQAQSSHLSNKLQIAEAALERQREASEVMSKVEVEAFQRDLAAAEQQTAEARVALAAASARAEAAERERDAAESAAATSDRLRQDVEAEAEAAAAVADAEKLHRAAATGEADALRADAERRAKAFKTAVAAAVGRVSAALEADRASLVARLEAAERRVVDAQQEGEEAAMAAAAANDLVAAAHAEAALAIEAAAAAEQAAHRSRSATLSAQQEAAEAAAARDGAEGLRRGGEQQLGAALERATQAEAQCAALKADLQTAKGAVAAATDRGAVQVALWRERAEAASEEVRHVRQAAASSGQYPDTAALLSHANEATAAAAAAAEEAGRWQRQVADLEQQVCDLRAAVRKHPLRLPPASDLLTSLGLDSWKDSRLGPKVKDDDDLEAAMPRQGPSPPGGLMAAASAKRREVVSQMKGTISARTWLVGGYLGLLHLLVMISFTQRNDLDALCADYVGISARAHQLPGT